MVTPAPDDSDPLPAFRRFAYMWLLLMTLWVVGLRLLPELTPPGWLAPLLDKLGVADGNQAVLLALRHGLG
jgi:hypothetical protein